MSAVVRSISVNEQLSIGERLMVSPVNDMGLTLPQVRKVLYAVSSAMAKGAQKSGARYGNEKAALEIERGFSAVAEQLRSHAFGLKFRDMCLGDVLKSMGDELTYEMRGELGRNFGVMFRKGSMSVKGERRLTPKALHHFLESAMYAFVAHQGRHQDLSKAGGHAVVQTLQSGVWACDQREYGLRLCLPSVSTAMMDKSREQVKGHLEDDGRLTGTIPLSSFQSLMIARFIGYLHFYVRKLDDQVGG